MKLMRSMILFVALALSAAIASAAHAQEFNRQAFPVGEEALGLGGAYAGRALDASATFYNPGGLVFGHTGSVSVSLSLSVFDTYRLGGTDPPDTDFEYRNPFGVPSYAGGSVHVSGNADGSERHALAFATFNSSRTARRLSIASMDAGMTDVLRISRSDFTRWYGVSYAYRPIREIGLGVSAFAAVRRFTHDESQLSTSGTMLLSRLSRVDLDAELVLFRIGALFQLHPTLSLGLTFQPPSIVVGARATIAATRAGAIPTVGPDPFFAEGEVGAQSPLPWQLRAGLAWNPDPAFLATLDAVLEGPVGSSDDPIRRVDFTPPAGAEGLLGTYFANDYSSNWVLDAAVGARVTISETVPISAGFFTSLSAAPLTEETSSVYRPDHIDVFGAALSVGFVNSDVDLAVGVVGSLGVGQGLLASSFTDLAGPAYRRADVESQTLYIFISGAEGFASAISRTVVDEILHEGNPDSHHNQNRHRGTSDD